jgi:hypothetical protein
VTAVDHIVVAAASLDEGVRWCEATLGVTPNAGGAHPLMGTHNRLIDVSGERFARCYLEIIAIDPGAPAPTATRRWFDLDDPAMQQRLREHGPRLVHWAVCSEQIDELAARVDSGTPRAASRQTPHGELRWRITIRDDGRRGAGGALPTLIEWGDRHPCDRLPPSGVVLRTIEVAGLDAAFDTLQLAHAGVTRAPAGAVPLAIELDTPRGRVRLMT